MAYIYDEASRHPIKHWTRGVQLEDRSSIATNLPDDFVLKPNNKEQQ